MFLELLRRRNQPFLDAVVRLHRRGEIPAGSFAIDLDAVRRNARRLKSEGDRLGAEVFAMTKQVGRGAPFLYAVREGGIDATVAVDIQCAAATGRAGLALGHVGHLVQVPRAAAVQVGSLAPRNWTVFNLEKAAEAARAASEQGRTQRILARIVAPNDQFYPGHEGGFDAAEVGRVADAIDAIDGAQFAGLTSFPAALFDPTTRAVTPTHNLRTIAAAAERLRSLGRNDLVVNAPGTNSIATMRTLVDAGAGQLEPGHALTGTTPLHAIEDLPEKPAVLYVSEISHHVGDRAYCFGGGFYVDPVFGDYELKALVAEEEGADAQSRLRAELPPPEAIDYYGMLDPGPGDRRPAVGATVIFGFRVQAFVTRAPTVGIDGCGTADPRVVGIWRGDGSPLASQSRDSGEQGSRRLGRRQDD